MWGKTVKANKVKKDEDILRESQCNFSNSQFLAASPLTSALPPLCPFPAQPVPLPSRPDFRLKTAQLRCNAMQLAYGQDIMLHALHQNQVWRTLQDVVP